MGRLGAFCARHHLLVIAVWILLVAGMGLLVTSVGAVTSNNVTLPGTGSQRASDLLEAKFPPQQNGGSPIVFFSSRGKVTDPANEAVIKSALAKIRKAKDVFSAVGPFGLRGQGQLSDDERTAFISVVLDVDSGDLSERRARLVFDRAVEPARRSGMEVAAGGPIGSALSSPETATSDLVGIIAAMVILALTFGALIAMALPVLSAVTGLLVGLAAIGLLGHVTDIPDVGATIATMIGLGVGIDYALFLVSRHRQQLRAGMDVHPSVARADATSGASVLFAGSTVIVALLALAVAGIPLVTALGYAAATAVLTAIAAALTLLPAVMALLGQGINRLALPRFLRPRHREPSEGLWGRWARTIGGHPGIAIIAALIILLPLAVPLLSLELGLEDISSAPTDTTERQAYDLMSAGFGPGYNGALVVAMDVRPPAEPSASFRRKKHEALALQRQLERQQAFADRKQRHLEREGEKLEAQRAALERRADSLNRRKERLEARAAALQRERSRLQREADALAARKVQLETRARRLAARAIELVRRLVVIRIRERVIQRRLEKVTDPARRARLEARLAQLRAAEANVLDSLARLRGKAETLLAEARRLEARAAALQAQADRLAASASRLQSGADRLAVQGAELEVEAARLQGEAERFDARKDRVTRRLEALKRESRDEQRTAKRLQAELTKELTAAGGDPKGTDPRLVHLQNALEGAQGVDVVAPPQVDSSGDAATFGVISKYDPAADATAALVARLRDPVIPNALAGTGLRAYVGGQTASSVDLATEISDRLLLVIITVIALSFLVLLVAFRSATIPFQAAIMNLLCVAAAFGVLTATFQWGWGISLVGLDAPRGTVPIVSYVPLMMFAVLFGLSMDYEVFLVSHVREEHAKGIAAREAVVSGLTASGPVVGAAALIMISVFGSYILNGDPVVKQFGVGLSVAVALAASMMLLLAPAVLVLLGERAWWFPRWLRWLPEIDVEGGGGTEVDHPEPAAEPG